MTVRHRSHRDAPISGVDGRIVRIRLCMWDTPADVIDPRLPPYREQFARGGLLGPDPAPGQQLANVDHAGQRIGRIVSTENQVDGLYADVLISASAAGNDLLADIDAGILQAVSAEFEDDLVPTRRGELLTRTRAVLTGVAFTDRLRPQRPDAAIVGRRGTEEINAAALGVQAALDTLHTAIAGDQPQPTPPPGETPMETEAVTETETETVETQVAPVVPLQRARPEPSLAVIPATRRTTTRFRSYGHFAHEVALGGRVTPEERLAFQRAFVVADAADVTGLQPQAWMSDIVDLRKGVSPTVQAFSQRPLPAIGETINQPKVTQTPLIDKQIAQGAAIVSREVRITPVPLTVDTYAGGQGMTLQTMQRSTPDYLTEVMRLHTKEMMIDLNKDVVAGVLLAADDVNAPIVMTAAAEEDAFIDAIAVILGLTFEMASVAVLSIAMWKRLGKLRDGANRPRFVGLNGVNPSGSFDLATTDGEIKSLRYYVDPMMVGDVAVVAMPDAYRTLIGPQQSLASDDPETLTHRAAVYCFAAHGVIDASGLVRINAPL